MAVTRLFGASVKRREDPRLITGRATYTDDVKLPGMVHMAVLRSPYGHARIRSIDTSQAAQAPGVKGVYTNADLEGKINPLPCAWLIPDSDLKTPPYPALAKDRVRYAGDAVAMVVADSPAQARDALDLIQVDYEPLPAVTSQERAAAASAPQLHDEVPGNLAFHWKFANGDVDAAFRDAEVVVKHRFVQQRLVPNAMEPRSAVASWNPGAEELTVYNTTQNPHIARFLTSVICNIPENKVRFLARDVGGGFGSKIPYYGGEALAIFAS